MPYLVGVTLAIVTALFAWAIGLDRDRSFFPTILIIIPLPYVLFAVMGASASIVGSEVLGALAFTMLAAIGFKKSMWLVAAATIGHGLFDAVHHFLITNPGVPSWWPAFCGAYDVAFGVWLALLLGTKRASLSLRQR